MTIRWSPPTINIQNKSSKKPPNGKVVKGSISVKKETHAGVIAEITRKFRDGNKMRTQTIYCHMSPNKYRRISNKIRNGKLGHLKKYRNKGAYHPDQSKCIWGSISIDSYYEDGVVATIEKEYVEDHILHSKKIHCAMTMERYEKVLGYVQDAELNNLLHYEHGEGYPPSEFPDI